MKEDLISFETAKLAKKKGFNPEGYTVSGYSINGKNSCMAFSTSFSLTKYPILTCYQAILHRWLRETHNIFIYVDYQGRPYIKDVKGKTLAEVSKDGKYCGFKYEEGLEMALFEALKLIK